VLSTLRFFRHEYEELLTTAETFVPSESDHDTSSHA